MMKKTLACLVLLTLTVITTAQAQDAGDKLSIHGHLTQAYAESDGHQLLGIGSDGTTNYRTAALQFRYDLNETHNFVIQFSHEELGDSPYQIVRDDLELDWAFYQHNFDATHSLKVGKVQMPWGIYNEIRDVGTVLPFYRPPTGVYLETLFGAETIDGVVSSNSFGGEWELDADLFLGGYTYADSELNAQRARNAGGVQLWLRTPVPGLRFGAAIRTYDSHPDGVTSGPEMVSTDMSLFSVDATFSRFMVRAEYESASPEFGEYTAVYAQVGFHVNDKLSLYAQVEEADLDYNTPFGKLNRPMSDDVGFAAAYRFGPGLLRLEHHQNTGLLAEDLDLTQIAILDPVDTDYFILSVSTSF